MPVISLEHRTYIQFLAREGLMARQIHRLFLEREITTISLSGIQQILNKLRRYQTVKNLPRTGRPRSIRTQAIVDKIKDFIQQKQGLVSYTSLSRYANISRTSVHRILKNDLKYYCYKPIRTQYLTERNIQKRLEYSQIILDRYIPHLDGIIFSDETYFSLGEYMHPQNNRIWTSHKKKLHIPVEVLTNPTPLFPNKVMVWCGVSKQGKLPLIFFQPGLRLTAQGYKRLVLVPSIPEINKLYENTPYANNKFIFQQDGAPSHTARTIRSYFANKNIQLLENYPPSSPDLSVLDYFVFGTLKQRVYAPPAVSTMEELKNRIKQEWEQLPLPMIRKAINQFPQRLQMVIEAGGHVIQHQVDLLKRKQL